MSVATSTTAPSTTTKSEIYIGGTAKRGVYGGNWIGKGEVTREYEGSIPFGDIYEGLLNWEPLEVPNANLIPVDVSERFDTIVGGQAYRISVREDHKAIVRSDNHKSLAVFKNGYDSTGYKGLMQWTQSALYGGMTNYSTGLLGGGTRFFTQFGLDETMHDGKSGLDFLPFVMFQSSLDGSLANSWSAGSLIGICDNMFAAMKRSSAAAGRQMKLKRSRYGLSDGRLSDLRSVLAVTELETQSLIDFLHQTVETPLDRSQWLKTLDILIPIAGDEASKAAQTKSNNRRNVVDALYQNDPMVAQWTGTAFGAIQAFNTYAHHHQSVRGSSRVERVYDRVLRGDMAQSDTDTVNALSRVLGRDLITV
jgi:phage/plasmid-like protein (TIGR03299 family)